MIQGKNIFVTGGAGFIGSSFIGRMIENNKIVAFDNLERDSLKNKPFVDHPNLTLIVGNVMDFDQVCEAMPSGTNIVVHCASILGIETVLKRTVETMRVNMIGSANVLEAADRLPHCDRVVCLSTSEIFGRRAIHVSEKDNSMIGSAGEARWTYAVSKLAEEHLAIAYFRERGLPTSVLRPFNIYGPGQIGEGAMRTFIMRAVRNELLEIHGDGTQIRAWCYVEDMIDALTLAIEHPKAVGETFNIGNQKAVISIYGLANTVIRVVNSTSPVIFNGKEDTNAEFRIPDVSKARELLGFEAKTALEDGIRLTADYYRAQ
jgi:UDP-glucose 4-epimerase